MGNIKKLASETAIYGVSNIVGKLINWLLTPLLILVFSAEEYGVISDFYAKAAIFNILYTFGMETAYFRFASRIELNPERIFNLSLSAVLVAGLFFSGLLVLLANPIVEVMQYPGQAIYVYCFAAVLFLDAVSAIPLARLRHSHRAKRFVVVRLSNIGANVVLSCAYLLMGHYVTQEGWFPTLYNFYSQIYQPGWAIAAVFLINALASLLQWIMLLPQWKSFSFTLSLKELKPMLQYALPLLFTGLAGMLNEVLDRDLLKYYLPENFYPGRSSLYAVGVYSACYKLSIFISLAVQAFRYAAEPFFFSRAQQRESPKLFAVVMRYFLIVCLFMFVGISVNLELIQYLFGRQEYRDGIFIVPVLLLANVFLGVYFNLTIWFKLTDKTYFGLLFSIMGAVITILVNLWLIPQSGYFGSALATLMCYVSMCVVCYWYGQRYYPIPYHLRAGGGYTMLAILLVLAAWFAPVESSWLKLVLGNGLLLIFIGVTFLLEWRHIRQFSL